MANTVIGFFRDRSEAADAVTQLTRSGFDRSSIDISNGATSNYDNSAGVDSDYRTTDSTNDYAGSRETSGSDRHENKGNAITRFFNSLFGDDTDDAKRYSQVGETADSIVTVHATTREQAEEAANILDACGAMDIDEGSLASDTYPDSGRVSSTSRSMDPYASGSDMSAARMTTSGVGDSTGAGLTNTDLVSAGINPNDLSADDLDNDQRYRTGTGLTPGAADMGSTGMGTSTTGSTDMSDADYSGSTSTGRSSGLAGTRDMDTSTDMGSSTGLSGSTGIGGTSAVGGSTGMGMSGTGSTDMGSSTPGSDYSGNQYSTERSLDDDMTNDDLSGTRNRQYSDNAELGDRNYDNTGNNQDRIDVVREDLQVGKRSVETGGVRIRSRIIERPVEENLRLREEHVRVHRQPVDRVATMQDMDTFREKEIELTEHAEVPVVNKEARVVEEIRVTKEVNERNETIRDTVRETEVDIDDDTNRSNKGGYSGSGSGNYTDDERRSTDLNSGRS